MVVNHPSIRPALGSVFGSDVSSVLSSSATPNWTIGDVLKYGAVAMAAILVLGQLKKAFK
jgi:hypothetical protein